MKKTLDDSLTDAVVEQMKETIKKQANTKKSQSLDEIARIVVEAEELVSPARCA